MFQSMLLGGLPYLTGGESRAINAENPRGEKGKGGTAASHLGPSRKGSPCIGEIKPGETALLGEMEGPGGDRAHLDHRDGQDQRRRPVRAAGPGAAHVLGRGGDPVGRGAPGGLFLLRLRPGVPGQFPAHGGQPQPGL